MKRWPGTRSPAGSARRRPPALLSVRGLVALAVAEGEVVAGATVLALDREDRQPAAGRLELRPKTKLVAGISSPDV